MNLTQFYSSGRTVRSHMRQICMMAGVALLSLTKGAWAAPEADARFIVEAQLSEANVAQIRVALKGILPRHFRPAISDLGGMLVDPSALAAMLPDQIVDSAIAEIEEGLIATYLTKFSATEIADIATFYRTSAGQMILALAHASQEFTTDADGPHITGPTEILIQSPDLIVSVLSAEELAGYEAFVASPTGQALKDQEMSVNFAQAFVIFGAYMQAATSDLGDEMSYLLPIIEADGIVVFPNRIIRQKAIDRLIDANN